MSKSNLKERIKGNKFFVNNFGFESGIDIANDTQVLYRKNYVIKNIVFISNLIYSIVFSLLSLGHSSNWLLSVLLFPITFVLNSTLKKLINKNPEDNMRQTLAMYTMSFYMFLSTLIIYIKLKSGDVLYLKEIGYILIYYSLAICAFYQDKKMLKNIFLWVLILITILHFTVTYSLITDDMAKDVTIFIKQFFTTDAFKDILLRTILLCMFMLVLYISVAMANYMQDERRKELTKRRKVQEDFTKVITEIFEVSLNKKNVTEADIEEANILASMSLKLSSLLGYSPEISSQISDFSKIYIENNVNFNTDEYQNEDDKFEVIRTQTELGSKLISRIELTRKCEDIIRATFEGSNDDAFINRMKKIQNNTESQIILICDLYISMRSVKSYKKAYNHKITMNYIEEHFKYYFDPLVFERFVRFSSDFEELYNGM
jgi:hypothetical protein